MHRIQWIMFLLIGLPLGWTCQTAVAAPATTISAPATTTTSPRSTISHSPAYQSAAAASARGDNPTAVQALQSLVADRQRQGDVAGEIDARLALAAAYQAMGHITSAIDTLDESLTHLTHSVEMTSGSGHMDHAHMDMPMGGALPLAQKLDDPRRLFEVNYALASACMFSELSFKAEDYLKTAETLVGVGDEAARRPDEPVRYNDAKARALAEDLRAVFWAAQRSQPDEEGERDLTNYKRAIEIFPDALSDAEDARAPLLQARIAVNRCLAAQHNFQAGRKERQFDQEAHSLTDSLRPPREKLRLLLTLGWCELQSTDSSVNQKAYATLQHCQKLAQDTSDETSLSYAIGYTGTLYEKAGRLDEAMVLTQQALFHAQLAHSPESLYRWQWQVARIFKAQGKRDDAIDAFERAIDTLQNIRNDISLAYGNPIMHSSFRQEVGDAYLDVADLLISRGSESGHTADYLSAVDYIEKLKNAELEDYFQDKCANLYQQSQRDLSGIAAQNHAAIIYYIPLQDHLEILMMVPDGIKRFSSPIDRDKLMALMRQLHNRLDDPSVNDYERDSREAYKWLIAPMEQQIAEYTNPKIGTARHVETLVFVPDGAIRSVPMEALIGPDGKFLVEKYAICLSPGLQLMPPKSIPRGQVAVLANGLSKSVEGNPPLQQVPHELDSIQQIYNVKNRDKLLDRTFTLENLNNRFSNEEYAIVHIATHGTFSEDAHDTYLLTDNGHLDLIRLERLIEPSKFRGQPVELLSLSACHTAQGASDRATLGLAGVAVKAGARSVLATLWEVNDEATTALVTDFYKNLRSSSEAGHAMTKAEALRQAQIEVMKTKRHPYYWAPFLVIGNWL